MERLSGPAAHEGDGQAGCSIRPVSWLRTPWLVVLLPVTAAVRATEPVMQPAASVLGRGGDYVCIREAKTIYCLEDDAVEYVQSGTWSMCSTMPISSPPEARTVTRA
jgi:hypothetical protein